MAVALVGRGAERRAVTAALEAGRHLLVEGPAGTGKSLLVRHAAGALGRRVLVVEGSAALTSGALLGRHEVAQVLHRGFGEAEFVAGPLLVAMRGGLLLHVEEANRVPPDTLNLLLNPLGDGRITVPRVGEVRAEPGFALIASANDADPAGTGSLAAALAERMVRLRLDYQTEDEERAVVRLHAGTAPDWLAAAAVGLVRGTRDHPELVRGASIRGAIDLVLVAVGLAGLEGRDIGTADRAAADVVLRAALVALSGRITVRDAARTAEAVIRELCEDLLLIRAAVPTGATTAVALPSVLVRRRPAAVRPAAERAAPTGGASPEPREQRGSTLGSGGTSGAPWPAAGEHGDPADPGAPPQVVRDSWTDAEVADLADLAADPTRRGARRRQRRALAGTNPRLVQQLAVKIILRQARAASRVKRGSAQLRPARFRFQSDDLDLDRSLESIAANPNPEHDDFWVQERATGRRGIALLLDVSGSMAGAPLVRAALAAATGAVAAENDELATVLFWSRVSVVTSPRHPRPAARVVEEVLAVRSEGLTDIRGALDVGLRQLDGCRARDKIGILVSDGVHNAGGDPEALARRYPTLHVLATSSTPARLAACRRLAAAGGGTCSAVTGVRDLPAALTRCLDG
jgi:MoxR-like ATPase